MRTFANRRLRRNLSFVPDPRPAAPVTNNPFFFARPIPVIATDLGLHTLSPQNEQTPTEPPATQPLVYGLFVRAQLIHKRPWPGEWARWNNRGLDAFVAKGLAMRVSDRWREAVSTALLGSWCDPLTADGFLPTTALGALRAEARVLHRQLVPLWRRGTRHGRLLSLDADLGGMSLYDLVANDINLLAGISGGVFDDERLNSVLRALDPAERQVVLAYAEGEGTTWTEAAAATGAPDPEAFGERVRRKAQRLAAEQRRRSAQRKAHSALQDSLPDRVEPGTER
ncbi:hypothetical protein ABZT04_43005 [Streptomyces sp. NPDC005492]|uniref:hypothetical protein n=1 Tax=Streptomyces sp. NPDC005492 TaxID=3156883 RepID=UPI0033AA26F7